MMAGWWPFYCEAVLITSRRWTGQGFHQTLETIITIEPRSSYQITLLVIESLGNECYVDLDQLRHLDDVSRPIKMHAWLLHHDADVESPVVIAPAQHLIFIGHYNEQHLPNITLRVPIHLRYPKVDVSADLFATKTMDPPRIYIHTEGHLSLTILEYSNIDTLSALFLNDSTMILKNALFQRIPWLENMVSSKSQSVPRGNAWELPWVTWTLFPITWLSCLGLMGLMVRFS
jgi:hypothetical protein